jgi:hypothetical protein
MKFVVTVRRATATVGLTPFPSTGEGKVLPSRCDGEPGGGRNAANGT